MTEITRSQIHVTEISFLRRVAGMAIDRVRSSVIWDKHREPLHLHVEKSKISWLGHLVSMPPGCFLVKVFRLLGGTRTR